MSSYFSSCKSFLFPSPHIWNLMESPRRFEQRPICTGNPSSPRNQPDNLILNFKPSQSFDHLSCQGEDAYLRGRVKWPTPPRPLSTSVPCSIWLCGAAEGVVGEVGRERELESLRMESLCSCYLFKAKIPKCLWTPGKNITMNELSYHSQKKKPQWTRPLH